MGAGSRRQNPKRADDRSHCPGHVTVTDSVVVNSLHRFHRLARGHTVRCPNAFCCLVRKPGFTDSGSGGEKSYAAFCLLLAMDKSSVRRIIFSSVEVGGKLSGHGYNRLSRGHLRTPDQTRLPVAHLASSQPSGTATLPATGSWVQPQFGKDLPDGIEVPDGARAVLAGDGQAPAIRAPRQPHDGARLLG